MTIIKRTKEEIRELCHKCMSRGSMFEAEVARTVLYKQDCNYSAKQLTIICAGASFKGGSPTAHYQSGDWACDGFDW